MYYMRLRTYVALDEEPPIVGGTIGQTQPGTYDILGRYFYLGLQLGF